MQRLSTANFGTGPGKVLLGDSPLPNGILTTQFLMQTRKAIGISSANEFCTGHYVPLNVIVMENVANRIFARSDVYSYYKYGGGGAVTCANHEADLAANVVPPRALPLGITFVSPEEHKFGKEQTTWQKILANGLFVN